MSLIIKDSDTLATSETSSRPGSAAPGDPPTRPQPVALEVPVAVNGARTVEGGDKREPFSEATKTVMIHGNGAVIKQHSALAPGQLRWLGSRSNCPGASAEGSLMTAALPWIITVLAALDMGSRLITRSPS